MKNEPDIYDAVAEWREQNPGCLLEPEHGNLYRPHALMIHSGQFWRCKHGLTGFGSGMEWIGCKECEASDPVAFRKFTGAKSALDGEGKGI